MSAITHPDMVRIVEAHDLRPIPVDIDCDTLACRIDVLERALTPKTRLLVVAHLFGGRMSLAPLADVTRRDGLLLVEDCAQAFRGPADAGDALADVSLFSFGYDQDRDGARRRAHPGRRSRVCARACRPCKHDGPLSPAWTTRGAS